MKVWKLLVISVPSPVPSKSVSTKGALLNSEPSFSMAKRFWKPPPSIWYSIRKKSLLSQS